MFQHGSILSKDAVPNHWSMVHALQFISIIYRLNIKYEPCKEGISPKHYCEILLPTDYRGKL